jgi:hypothetical protein
LLENRSQIRLGKVLKEVAGKGKIDGPLRKKAEIRN